MNDTIKTQTCQCGNDTYHVKWELKHRGRTWVECTECGRPTRTVGDGRKPGENTLSDAEAEKLTEEFIDALDEANEGELILFDEAGGEVRGIGEWRGRSDTLESENEPDES